MECNYSNNKQKFYGIKQGLNSYSSRSLNESGIPTSDTLSNSINNFDLQKSNYLINNNFNNNNYCFSKNTKKVAKKKKMKKKVKFNEVVDIVAVKSFKQYNKCEYTYELPFIDILDENNNYISNVYKKRKKKNNCECTIF